MIEMRVLDTTEGAVQAVIAEELGVNKPHDLYITQSGPNVYVGVARDETVAPLRRALRARGMHYRTTPSE